MSVEETYNPLPIQPWYAIRVRSRCEKSVALMARHRSIEAFYPICFERRRYSDREKSVEVPLLPGYVFCRVRPRDRMTLLTIPGVMYVVCNGNAPVPMDADLASIKAVSQYGRDVQPVPYLEIGQPVRVEYGPLSGCAGAFQHSGERQRLVLSFSLLRRAISVKIDPALLRPDFAGAYAGAEISAAPRQSRSLMTC